MGQLHLLLHGTLSITIYEADSLGGASAGSSNGASNNNSNNNSWSSSTATVFKKIIRRAQTAVGVGPGAGAGAAWNALYATVDIERARVARTRVLRPSSTAGAGAGHHWNETFDLNTAHVAANVVVSVKNDNAVGATLIGRARIPASDVAGGSPVAGWFPLFSDDGQPVDGGRARVRLHLRFTDLRSSPPPSLSPSFKGLPNAYFKQRSGCRVTLYHDAHEPGTPSDGVRRCWLDVFNYISTARHLVYIAGWSVYTAIRLLRDPAFACPGSELTLGELLRQKADGGVRVLLLVWDDRTSVGSVRKDGLMATHDQDTFNFFRGTNVQCVLCPRVPDGGNSLVQGIKGGAMFTHHQKTITVDAPDDSGARPAGRRIVSFIGGIDLCNGRYDTPQHSLFRTLGTVHRDDFHQPNFADATVDRGGPREPWHDIHCLLEGPAAWDVLHNFEQRWRRQGSNPDLLVRLSVVNVSAPRAAVRESDRDAWHVQVLRSIDGGATDFRYRTPGVDVAGAGLVSGKDTTIERSIHDAYVAAIRRAQRFVYIENQYFLGSCFGWAPEPGVDLADIGALHLIPKELSLKIVSKIEAGERFCVYVVVPMWPEGPPASASVQAILYWQLCTMRMMYEDVANALSAKGMRHVSPTDYLAFFCLCNREAPAPAEFRPPQMPDAGSDYRRAQEQRRFMIYVHAKMMIVDDEYVIVGSANINQRSMDGGRDSEIAMGAYQPNRVGPRGSGNGDGGVARLRKALWREHMGGAWEEAFARPDSVECVRRVKSIGDGVRQEYARDGETRQDVSAHLMSYPLDVLMDGSVRELPGLERFPDTQAKVMGTRSQVLPPILTC